MRQLYATLHSLGRYLLRAPVAGNPLRMCLTITDKCNLRCQSCAIWQRTHEGRGELSLAELTGVVRQAMQLGVRIFYIFGGEPLIRREFFELVKLISAEHGLFSETVTNGTLISEEVARQLVEVRLNKIWISLDGPPAVHDALRGVPGTFEKTLQGLKRLVEAKQKARSPMLIDLAVTISALNYRHLPELIECVRGIPLYEINIRHMGVFFEEDIQNINQTIGKNLGVTVQPDSLCFSSGGSIVLDSHQAREFKLILRQASRLAAESGIPLHVEPALWNTFDWHKGRPITSCLHLWTQININAAGGVVPCLWYDLLEFGNIREEPLGTIWNNVHFQYMRTHLKEVHACSKCCYFYLTLPQNIKRAIQVANFPFKSLLVGKPR